jgi:hypothetical protein
MQAVAHIEAAGTPIDIEMLLLLRDNWSRIQEYLIQDKAATFGLFDGRTFKEERFAEFLHTNGIAWPRLESGRLSLRDEAFKDGAKTHPKAIGPIRDIRNALSQMRLEGLSVGKDGRNRCLLNPLGASTGRNQPSNARFIFGPSAWIRSLIKPAAGRAVAYIDWEQQEFCIAAVKSEDARMLAAYESGDAYLATAKAAGAITPRTP